MPEIKHTFTGGKMNKDIDERLVPNGEYRDAMNIQVATSEDSDVATAQNILGNRIVRIQTDIGGIVLPSEAATVASIPDEINDKLYYFIWTKDANYIVEYVDGDINAKFVFIDDKTRLDSNNDRIPSVLKFSPQNIITGINVIDGMIFWTDNESEPKKIKIERCKQGTAYPNHTKLINEKSDLNIGDEIDIQEKHITVIKKSPTTPLKMRMETTRDPQRLYTAVIDISVDETINEDLVERIDTNGVVDTIFYDFSDVSIDEEITLDINKYLDNTGTVQTGADLSDMTGWGNLANEPKVVLQAFDETGNPPSTPITNFVLKGAISDYSNSNSTITIRISSIDGFPIAPAAGEETLQYAIDLFDEEEKLFEFKFPRFAYRYKFQDGEYSPFSPFTQVAFAPGSFDYHPRKGYNLGMINRLTKVDLGNIVTEKTPKDVVSIDILFKEEPSPNIYVVDTIKPNDDVTSGTGENHWDRLKSDPNANYFEITKETVNSTVPSNQLLRPWDNVPRKALSQEITASRVIYGNYVQNYDLVLNDDPDTKYIPTFDVGLVERTTDNTEYTKTSRSIKSLREYQLGVVFIDKYGRETPVLSNTSGTFKTVKEDADDKNAIKARVRGIKFPKDLTHFKWFVKETSGEYYNMAMDRWYSAEDDNIWLAFPSSDRNKIDIDTFLILKKGTDSDTLVKDQARYKVLAIENEAPDFIKTSKTLACRITNTGLAVFGSNTTNAPLQGEKEFKMAYEPFYGSPGQNLHDITDSELYIEFQIGTQVSNRYKIASITCDFDPTNGPQSSGASYSVRLKEQLNSDVNFITNDPLGINVTNIDATAVVNVYKYKVENKPQFDGRFFVKIYYDEVFRKNIVKSFAGGLDTRVVSEKRIYGMHRRDLHRQLHLDRVGKFATDGRDSGCGGWSDCYEIKFAQIGSMFEDMAYQVGYYLFKNFTQMALYFRRYKKLGTAEETPSHSDYAPYSPDRYRFLHLGKGSITNHEVEYQESHGVGDYWEYAGNLITPSLGDDAGKSYERWGEFGVTADGHDPAHVLDNSSQHYFNSGADYGQHGGGTLPYYNEHYTSNHGALTANWGGTFMGGSIGHGWVHEPQEANGLHKNGVDFGAALHTDRHVTRDTEVWFVDQGPYLAETYGLDCDWTGNHHDRMTRSFQDGNGIEDVSDNSFNMELAFGGITTQGNVEISGKAGGNATDDEVWENHFNIGGWNITSATGDNLTYNTPDDRDFVNSINTNSRFKIKEDPTGTTYTIMGGVISTGKFRHSNYAHWGDNDQEIEDTHPNLADPDVGFSSAEQLSFNFTKNWKIDDIQGPFGSTDLFAKYIMRIGRIPQSAGGARVTLNVCDSSGNTTGSQTSVGTFISDDLKIYVTSLQDSDGNFLHEGMALYKYQSINQSSMKSLPTYFGSPVAFGKNEYLVVRKINEKGSITDRFYELILGGYQFPLSLFEHSKIVMTERPRKESQYLFAQVGMNGYSPNSEFNINTMAHKWQNTHGRVGAVGYTLQWVDDIEPDEVLSENPAIFETEPKEIKGLDIYYESTGSIPIQLNADTIQDAFPLGSYFDIGVSTYTVTGYSGERVVVDPAPSANPTLSYVTNVYRPDKLIIRTRIDGIMSGGEINFDSNQMKSTYTLPWYNCFSFGNGVESNRIRDNFNLPFISNGVKVSSTIEGEYEEERRQYGLIYSGIYNSISGINNLNQFIQAEKITKDLSPIYGSIQKLHARDSDLVALCEDKILQILADKDAVFEADGNSQLVSNNMVLGQTKPFSGEYGISTNPESFAYESYRVYFSDKVRGAILRLSMDGLTAISDAGMKNWFRDNLELSTRVIGSYDDRKGEYNVKLEIPNTLGYSPNEVQAMRDFVSNSQNQTNRPVEYADTSDLLEQIDLLLSEKPFDSKVLTYNENVKGWVSFKSFVDMELGVSMANKYYTFKQGELYRHHSKDVDRNTFYLEYTNSSIDVMLNDEPSAIKVFNTLNYEGSQSKIGKFRSQLVSLDFQPDTIYNDQEFYNLYYKEGWYVDSIITDKEIGKVNEFIEKEGKWFNSINRVIDIDLAEADVSDFSFQGIGTATDITEDIIDDGDGEQPPSTYPCPNVEEVYQMDSKNITWTAPNSNPTSPWVNYSWQVTDPAGNIAFSGVTDPQSTNTIFIGYLPFDYVFNTGGNGVYIFQVVFDFSDGSSCTQTLYFDAIIGCTDPTAVNYNANANIPGDDCEYIDDSDGEGPGSGLGIAPPITPREPDTEAPLQQRQSNVELGKTDTEEIEERIAEEEKIRKLELERRTNPNKKTY
tara:strand:- start:1123 stop:7950 length:6828 start_codon:yes stop_codon:yes gene_type:complete